MKADGQLQNRHLPCNIARSSYGSEASNSGSNKAGAQEIGKVDELEFWQQ
jgi:hypothetical protein